MDKHGEAEKNDQRASDHFVLRSAGVMSALTMVSRVLGLVRDMVLSSFFGATYIMDAFRVGYMLPNLFRRLLAEGSLTAAFIPIFTDYKNTHSREQVGRFISSCFYTLAVILLGLVLLGVFLAPWYVPLVVPEGNVATGGWALTIKLTQLMFPYIFFISLAALAMAGLNTFKVFGPSMVTPILLNLSIILSTFFLYHRYDLSILAPVTGVLIGGVLQLVFQLPFLWRKGVRFRPSLAFTNPYVKKIGKLMVPGAFGSGVSQINTLVSVYFVSLTGIEGLQWIMFISGRIVEVVHGVFTISLSTALLPAMSEHAFQKDMNRLHDKITYGLRMVAFLAFPATAGLILLRQDIVMVIFERGLFSSDSTSLTANVLFYYSFCLIVWAGIYILSPAFYALKNIWTPVRIAGLAMAVNILSNCILMDHLKEGAPPLSLAIAGIVQFIVLWVTFRSKYGVFPVKTLFISLAKILGGTVVMAGILCIIPLLARVDFPQPSIMVSLAWLLGRIVLAVFIYLGCMVLMKSQEWRSFTNLIKGKFRG